MSQPAKHVIILGAGASATSGYPVAATLTKVMADPVHLQRYLDHLVKRDEGEYGSREVKAIAKAEFEKFDAAGKLLKSGSFATMDELSHLAFGGERAGTILDLKRLLRFVFTLDNPHVWHWGESDYPAFVNSLFRRTELPREDVSILSFNYDPYLEYLLWKAVQTRESLKSVTTDKGDHLRQAATGGMMRPEDLRWLDQPDFCHLKLHGICAFPPTKERLSNKLFTSGHMFELGTIARYSLLRDLSAQHPPVLLPWEIIHPTEARPLSKDEFLKTIGTDWQHCGLYPLFLKTWERAR